MSQPFLQKAWSTPKIIGVSIFAVYFFSTLITPGAWHFIDNVDLIIHEAGHTIFFMFGEFLAILAGSFFQVLIPLICAGYFIVRAEFYSGSLVFFWVGQSIVNVSVYARDAVVMQLPLLGGESVIHDWNYLFGKLHLLPYTSEIAGAFFMLGVLCMIVATVGGIYYSRTHNILPHIDASTL